MPYGSHCVTCHPPSAQPKLVLNLVTMEGCKSELTSVTVHVIRVLSWFLRWLIGDTVMAGVELIPVLIHTVEKAISQSSHVQQVTEAAAVANLIAKLLTTDHNVTGMYCCVIHSH